MTMKRAKSFNQKLSFRFLKTFIANTSMTKEEVLEKGQQLFIKLADYMFENKLSLCEIIFDKVFFKVIDGFEYMLIRLNDFYSCLQHNKFNITPNEKTVLECFIENVFNGVVKVENITKFLRELGITEKVPPPTKFLDYSKLDAGSIRLFNLIIENMDSEGLEYTVEQFLGSDNIESYNVATQHKSGNFRGY